MMKTYCFKLYRAKRNKKLHRQINAAGLTYNHCIALSRRYFRLYHQPLWTNKLQKHLTKLKKLSRYGYLKEYGSQAVQDVTQRIERAYKLWATNRKNHVKGGPPGFRKVSKYKSFTLKQAGWKLLTGNRILINGQEYKYFKSREVPGVPKTLTVKRDKLGDFYIYIVCQTEENEVQPRTGKSAGFDFGFKTFLTSSDGKDIQAPYFFRKNILAVKKANQELSRKKEGSHSRRKARLALARLNKKIRNQRKDYHWKLAYDLCSRYALICLEDLNIKGMQKRFGKKISDLGFSQFIGILKQAAAKIGSTVVQVGPFYPSSQLCHVCGYQYSGTKDLKVREWICPQCGSHHDRDRNAALNILAEGQRIFAAS